MSSASGAAAAARPAERDRRVAQVAEWLGESQSRANMVHPARGRWGIKPHTLDAYLKRARDLIRAGVRADIQGGSARGADRRSRGGDA